MQRTTENKPDRLTTTIRRQSSTGAMRRYANNLPIYSVSRDLPQYFAEMLKRIEAAEAKAKG